MILRSFFILSIVLSVVMPVSATEPFYCGRPFADYEFTGHEKEGIKVYYNLFPGDLVFLDQNSGKQLMCAFIGKAWGLGGFSYGYWDVNSSEKTLLFEITQADRRTFFDVKNNRRMPAHRNNAGKLIIGEVADSMPGEAIPLLRKFEGKTSDITERKFSRINSTQELKALWKLHGGEPDKVPNIAFQNSMVVAAFIGKQDSVESIRLVETREYYKHILLRYTRKRSHARGIDLTSPYAFYVFPRSSKKIIIEEELLSRIEEPAKIIRRAEIKALS